MYSLFFCVALLFPSVAARRIGGGGGSGDGGSTIGFHYEAPPLESAALAFYVLFLVATLILLGLATTYLFRARSGHRLPGFGVVLALVFLTIDYGLGVVTAVAIWSVDDISGDHSLTLPTRIQFIAAQSFFWNWIDPMVFAAVVLVLRDRYLTHVKTTKEASGNATSLGPFLIASCIFFIMMFTFATASVAVYSAAYNAFFVDGVFVLTGKFETLTTQLRISDDMNYTFLAVQFIATPFLVAFAIVVKKLVKTDTITTLTLTIITPLLTLRIISRIIFTILNTLLPKSASYTIETAYALDFASTFVFGVLFLAVTAVLVHFLMSPAKWDGPGTGAAVATGPGMYVVPQYGPGAPQYAPSAHPGYQPQAIYPGQWGYTGQPQLQYNGPYLYPPGQGPVPYYVNQLPPPAPGGASPGEDKVQESAPHSDQSPVLSTS